jgi:hypothetical protein
MSKLNIIKKEISPQRHREKKIMDVNLLVRPNILFCLSFLFLLKNSVSLCLCGEIIN